MLDRTPRESIGRYRDINRAPVPGELPAEGKCCEKVSIRHGAVADPNPSLRGKRQRVAINRQTDALEYEYSRGRIDEAAYAAGRCYQRLLERSRTPISGQGQWSPGNRVDQVISHEIAILNKIVRAQDVVAVLKDTLPAVGMLGERILAMVLIDGLTIKEAAGRFAGGSKEAGTNEVFFWGETFRRSLVGLADHWCGPRGRAPR